MDKISLVTQNVMGDFADTVECYKFRANRLWIVSPWIACDADGRGPVEKIVASLGSAPKSKCSVILITRPPKDEWHSKAIRLFKNKINAGIYYCEHLHAKIYLLECDGFRCAVLSSANLTARSTNTNLEIGIQFRTTVQESSRDDVAALISKLSDYVYSLVGEDRVVRADIE